MSFLSAIPIIGKVVDGLFGVIDQAVEDKDKANQLKADLELVFKNADLKKFSEQLTAQSSIVVAEAKGESWLQRNWRPMLMCLFGVIIGNNYVLYPYLSAFWEAAPMMLIPPEMWSLLKIGLGGYVVGRSTEKAIRQWKS